MPLTFNYQIFTYNFSIPSIDIDNVSFCGVLKAINCAKFISSHLYWIFRKLSLCDDNDVFYCFIFQNYENRLIFKLKTQAYIDLFLLLAVKSTLNYDRISLNNISVFIVTISFYMSCNIVAVFNMVKSKALKSGESSFDIVTNCALHWYKSIKTSPQQKYKNRFNSLILSSKVKLKALLTLWLSKSAILFHSSNSDELIFLVYPILRCTRF